MQHYDIRFIRSATEWSELTLWACCSFKRGFKFSALWAHAVTSPWYLRYLTCWLGIPYQAVSVPGTFSTIAQTLPCSVQFSSGDYSPFWNRTVLPLCIGALSNTGWALKNWRNNRKKKHLINGQVTHLRSKERQKHQHTSSKRKQYD